MDWGGKSGHAPIIMHSSNTAQVKTNIGHSEAARYVISGLPIASFYCVWGCKTCSQVLKRLAMKPNAYPRVEQLTPKSSIAVSRHL